MVWLPWKPHGDDEAGLKLGRLKPGQGARAAAAGAVVGGRDAPGQGGERDAAATEDQRGRRRPAAESAVAGRSLRTAQRGQGLVPAQPA